MTEQTTDYRQLYEHLQGLIGKLATDIPATMRGFGALHKGAVADGALSAGTKELIALGIAVAVRCDGCIAYHVHDAIAAGAGRAQVAETIGVAILMGGGPALMYGAQAYEALDQFEEAV